VSARRGRVARIMRASFDLDLIIDSESPTWNTHVSFSLAMVGRKNPRTPSRSISYTESILFTEAYLPPVAFRSRAIPCHVASIDDLIAMKRDPDAFRTPSTNLKCFSLDEPSPPDYLCHLTARFEASRRRQALLGREPFDTERLRGFEQYTRNAPLPRPRLITSSPPPPPPPREIRRPRRGFCPRAARL